MTTTTFPIRVDLVYTITDLQAQTHTIALSNDTLLLDNLPSTMSIDGADIRLMTEAGTYCVTAQAFWHAFAGAEPTAAEAGLLLADSLARWQVLLALQGGFQWGLEMARRIGGVPIPSYRFDPLVRQALLAFDGTEETTQLLARILQLDPEVVVAQARQLGFSGGGQPQAFCNGHTTGGSLTPFVSIEEAPATPSVGLLAPLSKNPAQRHSGAHFTDEQITRIRTAYEQSPCVKDMVAELAQEFGCPEHAVRNKLYSLHLPKKRNSGPHRRETSGQPAAAQEGDRFLQEEREDA